MTRLIHAATLVAVFAVAAAAQEKAAPEKATPTVVIGENAKAGGDGVAIGKDAVTKGHEKIAGGAAIETTAVGPRARAEGWRCSAFGAGAVAGVVSATALGRATYAWGAHMIAIGRGAYMERIEGSPELNFGNGCGIAGESLWLGGMMCHKCVDRTGDSYVHEKEDGGDGKARWDVRTFKPARYVVHGQDAYDARFDQDPARFKRELYKAEDPATWAHREDKDVAGGDLAIAAGRGTGTAKGGALEFQTAPAGAASANRKNALKTGVRIDTDYKTANATPMLLWDNQAGKLKRVLVGPPDSGGAGFRALVVEN
jgi:hypothetical protein